MSVTEGWYCGAHSILMQHVENMTGSGIAKTKRELDPGRMMCI